MERLRKLNPSLDDAGVQERYNALLGRGDRFVHRFSVGVSRTEVLRWMDEMVEVVQSMTAQHKAFRHGRRLTRNLAACKWGNMKCDYLSVCEHDGWERQDGFKVVPTDPFKPYEASDDNDDNDDNGDK